MVNVLTSAFIRKNIEYDVNELDAEPKQRANPKAQLPRIAMPAI